MGSNHSLLFLSQVRLIADVLPLWLLLLADWFSAVNSSLYLGETPGLLSLRYCKCGWCMCLLKACHLSFFSSLYTIILLVTRNPGRKRNVLFPHSCFQACGVKVASAKVKS